MNKCVYPVKQNVVHCCTEETVQHVHPSHTTVKKHHIVKNEHVYPHTTSVENSVDYVNINKGTNNMPSNPGHHGHYHGMNKGMHHGMNHGHKHNKCNKCNKWC